jgi:hypothetical protein
VRHDTVVGVVVVGSCCVGLFDVRYVVLSNSCISSS